MTDLDIDALEKEVWENAEADKDHMIVPTGEMTRLLARVRDLEQAGREEMEDHAKLMEVFNLTNTNLIKCGQALRDKNRSLNEARYEVLMELSRKLADVSPWRAALSPAANRIRLDLSLWIVEMAEKYESNN